jgi:peroxiredoxin
VCRSEAGAYAEFVEEHPELRFLGLDAADTPERGRAFAEEFDWTWPSISDPRRALAKQLGADYQPYVAVIDADGAIVATFAGGGDRATWEALVGRLD